MIDSKLKSISLRLPIDQIENIDLYAKKMRSNRTQIIKMMIDNGLGDLNLMHKTGLMVLMEKGVDLLSLVKKSLKNKEYKIEDENLIIDLKK
jgi:hypothetical protein